jgi:hypothetical protein
MATRPSWPIRLAPLPGEPLDSWLETYAHRLDTTVGELLISSGLLTDPVLSKRQETAANHTAYLLDHEARGLSQASGIPPDRLHAMTLHTYDQHAVCLDRTTRTVTMPTLWGKGDGSRYCPHCLHERDGRWLLRWRLSWTFACTRHHILLADRCPRCGQETRLRRSRRAIFLPLPPPGHCGARTASVTCPHNLTDAHPVELPDQHPLLATQHHIETLLDQIDSHARDHSTAITPRAAFDELHALASWVLCRSQPGDFHHLGAHINDACLTYQQTNRATRQAPGAFPPIDAAVTGAALNHAITILTNTDPSALRTLLNRETNRGLVPRALDHRPSRISPHLRAQILQARDADLSMTDRLRYRTCTTSPREPTNDLNTRAAHVPQLLWPGWTLRLRPPGIYAETFRLAVTTAILLPGSRDATFAAAAAVLRPNIPFRGNDLINTLIRQGHDTLLTAICAIADYLDHNGSPIDYIRRRHLIDADLLPEPAWQQICRQTATHPGVPGYRRLRNARRWIYQRLTGNELRHAPAPFTVTNGQEQRYYANLPLELPPPVLQALDRYATRYLASKGVDEPLTWEPPATCVAGLDLPGRDPADIDTTALTRLVTSGNPSPSAAATQLNTTTDHVRLALERAATATR